MMLNSPPSVLSDTPHLLYFREKIYYTVFVIFLPLLAPCVGACVDEVGTERKCHVYFCKQ